MPHCHRYAEKPSVKKQPKKSPQIPLFTKIPLFVYDRQEYPADGTRKLTFFSKPPFTCRMPAVLTKISVRILHPADLSSILAQELKKAREGLLSAVFFLIVENKRLRITPLHCFAASNRGLRYSDNLTPHLIGNHHPYEIVIYPKEVVSVELSWDKKMPFSTRLGCFAIEVDIEAEMRKEGG